METYEEALPRRVANNVCRSRLFVLPPSSSNRAYCRRYGLSAGNAGSILAEAGGTISGSVWNDANGNGLRDAGEPPIAGRRIYLDTDDDGVRNTTGGVEPDQFANGAALTHADPHVTLETLDSSNNPVALFVVTAADRSGYASTGTKVFAHAGVSFFNSSRKLRMTFSSPADRVSIDFAGGASIGTEVGRLEIYNAAGTLLDTYITQPKGRGVVERMSLTRPKPEIAYAIAYTDPSGSFGALDNLSYSGPEPFVVTAADGSYQFIDLAPGITSCGRRSPRNVQTAPVSTRSAVRRR
jgi:hypothetical protein